MDKYINTQCGIDKLNKLSKNMLNKNQNWYLYIKLLVRKTSNKFFRSIRHLILQKIYK